MLADKMTFISGIIIFYLISSTNCDSSEEIKVKETEIEVLVKNMKNFLDRVKSLDCYLRTPTSYDELDKVKTRHFFEKFKIKYKSGFSNWIFKHFRKQYKKFAEISKRCIEQYIVQINYLAPYPAGYLANKERRDAFVKFMDEDFKKGMSLKGDEDSEVVKEYEELQDEIKKIRNRINDMKDPPPPPPPAPIELKEKHHERSSSSSSSESDEEKSKKKKKEKKEKENYEEHHGYKEGKASHSSESKSHEDHDKAGLGTGLAVGLGAGLVTGIVVAEAVDNSISGEKEVIYHSEPKEHEVVEQSSAESASSSSAVEEEEAGGNEEGGGDWEGEQAD